ncbi:MAG TPA: hypothetical protein VFV75_06975 [Candidatus Polarisedimenticolaceae bacterium]|nr:hypothetical protein [Candidatus Polarisedimenticolaceae bacterium]
MHHRSRPAALLILLACLALGPASLADDVVHFQNGTFMKVQGYTVEGDTIKVNLGPGASMSFPRNLVESIERAGRTVYPQTSSGPANVVVSGSAGGQVTSSQYLQRGTEQIPANARAALGLTPPSADATAPDKDGAPRPDRGSFQMNGNHGQIRAMGRRTAPIGEALIEKDPTAPPPQVARPRGFTSLAARSFPAAPQPEPQAAPADPAPAEPETPVEDPPAEEDGGN